jgi:hypothetical protein
MSTEFPDKQSALAMACYYAGVSIEALEGVVPTKQERESVFGKDRNEVADVAERYTIKNANGEDVSFLIGAFRKGYDLWLISDDGVSAMRV